jgi:hypothetical protein
MQPPEHPLLTTKALTRNDPDSHYRCFYLQLSRSLFNFLLLTSIIVSTAQSLQIF